MQLGNASAAVPAAPSAADAGGTAHGWASRRVTVPLAALVVGFIALFGAAAAGVFVGGNLRAAPAAMAPPESAAHASFDPAVTGPSPDAPAESVSTVVYSDMPCDAGTWIVFLAAIPGSYTDVELDRIVQNETARATYVDRKHAYVINLTAYGDACPRARDYDTRRDRWTDNLMWIGPLLSERGARNVCTRLKKTSEWDCLWRRAA